MPSSNNDTFRHQVEPGSSRITSILLAAGAGTRLRPFTGYVPKPALPLLDVPLGAFSLTDLVSLGAPIIVNVSGDHELVQSELDRFARDARFVVEEPAPFGGAGTLASLAAELRGPVVTRNADLLSDLATRDLLRTHAGSGAPATIATTPVRSGADLIEQGGRAIRALDRHEGRAVSGSLWLGAAVIERECLDAIRPERPLDLWRGLLEPLIERGEVATYPHEGYALDVGTPERYLVANLDLLYDRAPWGPLDPPGEIVEVESGLAYRGPDVHVYKESLGPGAIVLEGAAIERRARIEHAVVWPDEVVPEGTTVVDGIWAKGSFTRVAPSE